MRKQAVEERQAALAKLLPMQQGDFEGLFRADQFAAFSIGAFVVMLVTVFTTGPAAMWALILVGFFHSIMFPTIFTLGIKGLGPLTEEGSGLLIMAIAGGALVYFQGKFADAEPLFRKADAATVGMINTVSHLVEVEEAE